MNDICLTCGHLYNEDEMGSIEDLTYSFMDCAYDEDIGWYIDTLHGLFCWECQESLSVRH